MSKNILITGSNKGIGFELAKLLVSSAPEFTKIILTARNEALGLQAVERLKGGDRVDFHVLDITNENSIQNIKKYVAEKYGHLDVLVNNAGILIRTTENIHLTIKPTIETNLLATIKITEAFLPIISPDGLILNVSSIFGRTAT